VTFATRVRTYYRHEDSARKGYAWAGKVIGEKEREPSRLPSLGRGYSARYRAAYAVESLARNKLQYSLPAHEAVFWSAVMDRAVEEKADESMRENPTVDPYSIESLLNGEPGISAITFGIEFDGGSLRDRAEDLAYSLGYEEGRSGRAMAWTKPLLSWASSRRMPSVKKLYDSGRKDGSESVRENPTFDASDFFDQPDEPVAKSSLHAVEDDLRKSAEHRDAREVIADEKLLAAIGGRYAFWRKTPTFGGAWFVQLDMPFEKSVVFARKVRKGLRARSKIPASVPMLHDLTLYVGTASGEVMRIEP